MEIYKEHKKGSVITHKGITLKVIEGYCDECYFCDKDGIDCSKVKCHARNRVNDDYIVFQEVK